MGILKKSRAALAVAEGHKPTVPLAIASPWQPTDALTQWAAEALYETEGVEFMTRDIALRIPGVKRAHGIHCTTFAELPFFEMNGDTRTDDQPEWLTNSRSGVSPYHMKYGIASDLFFNGWACIGFTAGFTDAMHIPYGMWGIDADGYITVTETIPEQYRAYPVAIPLGYGENGLLADGLDTLRQARAIDKAYNDRLGNPVPLTILDIPWDVWSGWTREERQEFRAEWIKNRRGSDGSVAMKPQTFGVDMPGATSVDLFEQGRNANRLDIANHTGTPASLLEGTRQGGGGGSEIRYSGVQNGATRNELWDYGLAKRFTLAFESRMSLDDVCPPGLSIRADLSSMLAAPHPNTNPTSED